MSDRQIRRLAAIVAATGKNISAILFMFLENCHNISTRKIEKIHLVIKRIQEERLIATVACE